MVHYIKTTQIRLPEQNPQKIKHMLQVGHKLELEALSAKGIRFISEKYLPEKIKKKDFLP